VLYQLIFRLGTITVKHSSAGFKVQMPVFDWVVAIVGNCYGWRGRWRGRCWHHFARERGRHEIWVFPFDVTSQKFLFVPAAIDRVLWDDAANGKYFAASSEAANTNHQPAFGALVIGISVDDVCHWLPQLLNLFAYVTQFRLG
jgi:hypothetical protein